MALEQVTEFFGLHLTAQQKQNLRVAAVVSGYASMSEFARDLLSGQINKILEDKGIEQPELKKSPLRNPQPMR